MGSKSATGATQAGARTGTQALNQTTNQGIADVMGGTGKAVNTVTQAGTKAAGQYAPYQALGTGATTQLEKLLGIKGGSAGALKTLESTPGYQFALKQGDQGTINAATATGMNLSGNTLEGLSQFNKGLASQTFNSDVSNLEGAAGLGLNAAGGAANANLATGQTVAGLEAGMGNTEAQLLSNKGTGIANVDIGQGTNLANIGMAQAASESAIASSAGNDFLLANMQKQGDFYNVSIDRFKPCRN